MEIKIQKANILQAYNNGCTDVKKTLLHLFPQAFEKSHYHFRPGHVIDLYAEPHTPLSVAKFEKYEGSLVFQHNLWRMAQIHESPFTYLQFTKKDK